MIASFSDRRFQLWEYSVSHGYLLVRSPKGLDATTNIDLMFAGVEYVAVPRLLRGLELAYGSTEDADRVRALSGHEVDVEKVFVLASHGLRHLIVAASLRVDTHEGDIFDSPFSER